VTQASGAPAATDQQAASPPCLDRSICCAVTCLLSEFHFNVNNNWLILPESRYLPLVVDYQGNDFKEDHDPYTNP
jgi:hypothetical protein